MTINGDAVAIYGVGPLALNGLASPFNNRWNFLCIFGWFYMVLVSQCGVVIPFIFRYFAVCR